MARSPIDKVGISRDQFIVLLKTAEACKIINDWSAKHCEPSIDDEELSHQLFDLIKNHQSRK